MPPQEPKLNPPPQQKLQEAPRPKIHAGDNVTYVLPAVHKHDTRKAIVKEIEHEDEKHCVITVAYGDPDKPTIAHHVPYCAPSQEKKRGNTWYVVAMLMTMFALLFAPAPKANGAAMELLSFTNVVRDGVYPIGTNRGAAFKMMYDRSPNKSIVVKQAEIKPTNVLAGTGVFWTGDTVVNELTITNSQASGDSCVFVSSTNGFQASARVIIRNTDGVLYLGSVSNVISGSNCVAFNQTFGAGITNGAKLWQLNKGTTVIFDTTNRITLPNIFATRKGYPFLYEQSDGGYANFLLEFQ